MQKTKAASDTYRMHITISEKFSSLVKKRAESLGIKPQEYLKYLIIQDISSGTKHKATSPAYAPQKILTKEIKRNIESAREKRARNSYQTIIDSEGIEELLNNKKFKGMRTIYTNTTEI